jgi:HAD superfamily hydrolase (TIGR01548 family)
MPTTKNRAVPIPDSPPRRRNTATKSLRAPSSRRGIHPQVIIFDIDGVLVETRDSFLRTTLETVEFFTKKRVTMRQLHEWKNRPGFNDDWKLSTAWVRDLGFKVSYDDVKKKFQEIYWGKDGKNGNVLGERWLFPIAKLQQLARRSELALFTGRVLPELDYTLDRNQVRRFFTTIMSVENMGRPKPAPDGLLKILKGRAPGVALYLGDNIDDALAAKSAGVPFLGVLPRNGVERRQRGPTLKKLGALAILGGVNELEPWLNKRNSPRAS